MPIIINEFEIVPGPAAKAEGEASTPPAPPPPLLVPEDVERIEERHRRRLQRLWAD
jgi:hypothetical protein